MQTSASVKLIVLAVTVGGLLHGSGGVWLIPSPSWLSLRVGVLLGGAAGSVGPIRKKDSVSAKDKVRFLWRPPKLELELAAIDSLDAMCAILQCVSS